MALNGLLCPDVPLRTYTLTHSDPRVSNTESIAQQKDKQRSILSFEQPLLHGLRTESPRSLVRCTLEMCSAGNKIAAVVIVSTAWSAGSGRKAEIQ